MNKILIGIGLVGFFYSCFFYHNHIKKNKNNDEKDNKNSDDDDNEINDIVKEEINKIVDKVIKDRKVHFDDNWIEINP